VEGEYVMSKQYKQKLEKEVTKEVSKAVNEATKNVVKDIEKEIKHTQKEIDKTHRQFEKKAAEGDLSEHEHTAFDQKLGELRRKLETLESAKKEVQETVFTGQMR
jgi:uncharacterized coiled-coil DUF342 family protein